MTYTTESAIYNTTGFSSSIIQTLSGKTSGDVTTLISTFISDAENEINEEVGAPYVIRDELHLGDGMNNIFELGPQDERFGITLDGYDPSNGLVSIRNVKFARFKKLNPYPINCELGTEQSNTTGWTGSGVTISSDTATETAGTSCIKGIFTVAFILHGEISGG